MQPIKATFAPAYGGTFDTVLRFTEYRNGRVAIVLEDATDGELVATATVNLPEHDIPPTCVAVKDYSENEGMVDTLVKAGVIDPRPLFSIPSGFVNIGVFKLTPLAQQHAAG